MPICALIWLDILMPYHEPMLDCMCNKGAATQQKQIWLTSYHYRSTQFLSAALPSAHLLTDGAQIAGNVALAQQKWAQSAGYYQKAMQLAPAFSFAGANRTLALYAGGQTNEAMREMRCACLIPFASMSALLSPLKDQRHVYCCHHCTEPGAPHLAGHRWAAATRS